jgi:RNA polymerase sigma-70 factor (ECF subfamily)
MKSNENIKAWFGRMVKENMDAMYGMALRLTGTRSDAEDLVANAVIKAWSCIERLEHKSRVRPWIFRILRNEFISGYRKKSIRPLELGFDENGTDDIESIASMLADQPDEFLNWWANPEQEYVNRLLGEQIREAINQLPEVFRITVLLINVDGLSYDETSVVLGIPRGTVRSRMKRGRTMLQKALWLQAQEAGLTSVVDSVKRRKGV